jgi:hypothetical protein
MNLTLKRVSGTPCRARVHLMEETVLEAVEQDPRSARVISQMCGSSKFTTDRIIKGDCLRPYHYTEFTIYEKKTIHEEYAFVDGYCMKAF